MSGCCFAVTFEDMTKRQKQFLLDTPPSLEHNPGYVEYVWYDGPLIYSVGDATQRYFFQAIGDDDKSRALNVILYLVIPMSIKRERDICENKLSMRQAVLHSGGKLFKTYDWGATFEPVEIITEEMVCDKGARLDGHHPAWRRKYAKRQARRHARRLKLLKRPFKNQRLGLVSPASA